MLKHFSVATVLNGTRVRAKTDFFFSRSGILVERGTAGTIEEFSQGSYTIRLDTGMMAPQPSGTFHHFWEIIGTEAPPAAAHVPAGPSPAGAKAAAKPSPAAPAAPQPGKPLPGAEVAAAPAAAAHVPAGPSPAGAKAAAKPSPAAPAAPQPSKPLPGAEVAAAAAAAAASSDAPEVGGVAAKPKRKRNRWGDGLDAPAAGAREFFPNGWTPARDTYEAIQVFGHSDAAIEAIREKGEELQRELAMLDLVIPPEYISAVFAYTQEDEKYDLYGKLNTACRTSGFIAEKKIALYRDFMHYLQEALTTLPNFYGRVFRGIDCKVSAISYGVGKRITWQGFASASKLQHEARKFLAVHKGHLSGSLFVCDIKNGKEIDGLSAFPEEQEVLLKPNTFFNVIGKLEDEEAKQGVLVDLAGYNMEDLEVYILKQV